jgi:hypothetical protein
MSSRRGRQWQAALATAATLAGAGCAGSSCADLAQVRLERDEARAHYSSVTADRAAGHTTGAAAAHDAMHELDERVHQLEQHC